jgi:hypothetical protein
MMAVMGVGRATLCCAACALAGLVAASACSSTPASNPENGIGWAGGANGDAGAASGEAGAANGDAGAPGAANEADIDPVVCERPEVVEGAPGPLNLVRCANGVVHRPTAAACNSLVPRDMELDPDEYGIPPENVECTTDLDCETEHGWCYVDLPDPDGELDHDGRTYCREGCVSDDECGSEQICLCNTGPVGRCARSLCATDDDCEGAALCVAPGIGNDDGCSRPIGTLACQAPGDECLTAYDCEGYFQPFCVMRGEHRVCEEGPGQC